MTEESSETTSNTTLVLGFLSICAGVFAIFLAVELLTQQSHNAPPPMLSFNVDDPDIHFHYFESVERRLLKSTKSTRAIPQEKRGSVFVTRGDRSNPLNRDFVYMTNLDEKHGPGQHQAHRLRIEQALRTLDAETEIRRQQAQQIPMHRAGQDLSKEQLHLYLNEVESVEFDVANPTRAAIHPGQALKPIQSEQ